MHNHNAFPMTPSIIRAMVIFLLYIFTFTPTTSYAQTNQVDAEKNPDVGKFVIKLIMASETEFCRMYGQSLHGDILLPGFEIETKKALELIKREAASRKPKIDLKRFKENRASFGDTKCHVWAVMGNSLGEPLTVNTTATSGKVMEQYVMEHAYLYFENNIWTAMQSK